MYTKGMNTEEMANEFRRDVSHSINFVGDKINHEIKRYALKAKSFPMIKLVDWKNKNGNKYIVSFNCESKRSIKNGECKVAFYALLDNGDVFLAGDDEYGGASIDIETRGVKHGRSHEIYTDHFFVRYKQRFGLLDGFKSIRHQFVYRKIISRGFVSTVEPDMFLMSHGESAETLAIWKDGFMLGTFSDDKNLVSYKTFLPYDAELTERQKLYFNKMAQLHLDVSDKYDELDKNPECQGRIIRY